MLIGVAAPLLIYGDTALADDVAATGQSLELALKSSGASMPTFHLHDGQTIIGRFIGLENDSITVRRPSGGLRSIRIADIDRLEVVGDDGRRLLGSPLLLADGTLTFDVADPVSGKDRKLTKTADQTADDQEGQSETGGPLIRMDAAAKQDLARRDVVARKARGLDDTGDGLASSIAIDQNQLDVAGLNADDGITGLPEAVRLSVVAEPANESDRAVFFQLRLSEPARRSLAIIYTLLDGSAKAADDYQHRQGVVVFEPDQQVAVLAIDLIDDSDIEDIETFKLFVTGDPNSVIIEQRTAEASIQDNDA